MIAALARAQVVNINTANEAALTTLPGIGDVKAQAILAYRQTNGPFSSIDGLLQVNGIGQATFDKLKNLITIGDSAASTTNSNAQSATTTETADATSTASTSTQTKPSTSVSSYVPPPLPALFADAGDDRTVIVGADVEFDGRAYNRDQQPLNDSTTRFSWNFGDGATAEGSSVLHHFTYPGTYAVVLSIADDRFAVDDVVRVSAEPAALSFSVMADGGVSIENETDRNLDLSQWIVRAGSSPFSDQFIVPEHSILLSGGALRIAPSTLGFHASPDVSLAYPNGVVALGAGQTSTTSSEAIVHAPAISPTLASPPVVSVPSRQSVVSVPESIAPVRIVAESQRLPQHDASAPTSPAQATASRETVSSATSTQTAGAALFAGSAWWFGALLLSAAGAATLLIARRIGRSEWDVIEEKGE